MKKLAVLVLLLLSLASAKILVNGVDLANVDAHYIELKVGYGWGSKAYAYVNYGQEDKSKKHIVVDDNGKKLAFISRVDILNTFYKNGWEITSVVSEPYSSTKDSTITINTKTYYILDRIGDK